ncbi:MAG: 50S ribosomal protein L13 [Defluviitaleaceae bacterium]|nr:50S ribosomal protein L13 [Defluviitaleaceae bacterium]
MRTTFIAKPAQLERKWYVVDAEGQTLGRLSSEIAKILRGKHKPIFTPHVDTGDHVIVINAEKIKVTGNKMDDKIYRRHTGHPGGLKETTLRVMMQTKPTQVLRLALKGMLPKNTLGRACLGKLNVYAGPEHPHQAQKPEALTITY